MKSSSSGQNLSLRLKLTEWRKQFIGLFQSRNTADNYDYSWLEQQCANYEDAVSRYGNFSLVDAKIFEIGCGQRPYRLFYFYAKGFNIRAIDLDFIFIGISLRTLISTFYYNGFERLVKTVVRTVLFDRRDYKEFAKYLSEVAGRHFNWPMHLIATGSAADQNLWPKHEIDFVYSEDVFEHIPITDLPIICRQIQSRLSRRGIAWIKPLIFTGIQGGHSVDWYSLDKGRARSCPPWDHLRENRYPSNTFLNKLTRNDYRALFSQYFEILEEIDIQKDLGKEFMTTELRNKLSNFTDEDLYSNGVVFILKPKLK